MGAVRDQFPRGKFSADDEGVTALAIGVVDRTLIIRFPQPTTWIGLDKATTEALIAQLQEAVKKL